MITAQKVVQRMENILIKKKYKENKNEIAYLSSKKKKSLLNNIDSQ